MLSPEASSYNARRTMQANKRVSMTEMRLRKAVWRSGGRYRVQSRLPGRPDLAFTASRVAVFVHGCFWHRCPTCQLPAPRANGDFWAVKFNRNIQRDAEAVRDLQRLGWRAITIWEHEIRADVDGAALRVVESVRRARVRAPEESRGGA